MRSKTRLGPLIATAVVLLWSLLGQTGQPAPAWVAARAATPKNEFSGYVYEGYPRQRPRFPLPNVNVRLYGSDSSRVLGTLLASDFTAQYGYSYLATGQLEWKYYSLVETDPPGYLSTGAIAGEQGEVVDSNWIRYTRSGHNPVARRRGVRPQGRGE